MGWRWAHGDATATVTHHVLRLAIGTVRSDLIRSPRLTRVVEGGEAFVLAEVSCHKSAVDTWTVEFRF